MKKIFFLLLASLLLFGFSAPKQNPKSDIQKYMKIIENFTKVCKNAAGDKILDDNEIATIKRMNEEFLNFSDELKVKYDKNSAKTEDELKKVVEYYNYIDRYEEKLTQLSKELEEAIDLLRECRGYLKLKM